jgi:hypothetical protein
MITFTDTGGGLVAADMTWLEPADERALLQRASRQSRPTLRRTLTAMRAEEERLSGLATPAQRAITWGDCYRRDWPGGGPLDARAAVCYGYVIPLFEFMTAELAALRNAEPFLAAGQAEAEVQAVVDKIRRGVTRGWWHVRAWSVNEPAGEVGDEHMANMTPVSRAEFEQARSRRWQPPRELAGAGR